MICFMFLWGPIIYGPGPFALRKSEGPSQGELRPKLYNTEHLTVLWCSRGQLSPRQIQNPTRRRRVNWYRAKLKRESKNIRDSCSHCHSMRCPWQSRTLQLYQPSPTIPGLDWWDKCRFCKDWPYTWTKDSECRLV